ncbi:DUF2306 domain-containing protein [Shewanella corallii]|uniref:DUF2306 domain-containing protein n=1 Tax=Shewanella corallii TaxID=560080 RepID=A0ABT0N1S2_9GAMM|nr:DUF2306 domain-containing protein [Shewanella corallii]MCL2912388.1 DUF2306 domain-containing protein [Shewanella corallii]
MSDLSTTAESHAQRDAETNSSINWLGWSAKIWFLVTAIGQWLFVAYIAGYYGSRFAAYGVDGFEETRLANGFITGDSVGNNMLALHILGAGLIIAAGQLQLMPNIRSKIPRIHRYSGWFYIIASIIVSMAGTYLTWARERAIGSAVQDIGTTTSGVLVVAFAALGLYYAINEDFASHRRWMLRLFMVVSAVWFLRLMTYGWFMTTGGIGIDTKTFSGPFLEIVSYAQFVIPLAGLQLYFWAQKSKSRLAANFSAAVILLLTSAMAIGIFAVGGSWISRMMA